MTCPRVFAVIDVVYLSFQLLPRYDSFKLLVVCESRNAFFNCLGQPVSSILSQSLSFCIYIVYSLISIAFWQRNMRGGETEIKG